MDRTIPPILLKHFGLLAETPNGVSKLRELILQLAVQGNLVPQDPKDEPASALVQRIHKEKEQREKISTSKVTLPRPVDPSEKAFAVPKNWAWVRTQHVTTYVQRGKSPKYSLEKKMPVIAQKCIQWHGFELHKAQFIEPATIEYYAEDRFVQDGDLLWNSTGLGTLGRIIVFKKAYQEHYKRIVADSHVTVIRPSKFVLSDYLFCWFAGPIVQSEINLKASGSTKQTELATATVLSYPIPLPPLAEQKRIVAKVEELLALCDELEARQSAAREQRTRLVRSALDHLTAAKDEQDFRKRSAFVLQHSDLILDSVPALRQAILYLAVQGRLAAQNAMDEPAAEILSECQCVAKKLGIKTAEPTSSTGCSESLFDLPSGWAWAKLRYLGYLLGGGTPSKSKTELWEGTLPWVSPKDMKVTFLQDSQDHISRKALSASAVKLIPPGSLLFVVRGMILIHSFPAAINEVEVTINQDMKALQPFVPENIQFLLLACRGFRQRMLANVERSTHGTCKLVTERVMEFVIGLPPLAEQKRIVAKVEELMRWCDALEARLTAAQNAGAELLDAALNQVLAKSFNGDIDQPERARLA
jgi:type I restriction enzyme S subunit